MPTYRELMDQQAQSLNSPVIQPPRVPVPAQEPEGFWGETVDYIQDRAGDLGGYVGRAAGRGIEGLGGLLGAESVSNAGQALQDVSTDLINYDFGYDAANNQYSWEQVKENKDVATLAGYIVREGLGSLPDMAAFFNPVTLGTYGVAQVERLASERAQMDNRADVDASDYAVAVPTAIATVMLDKLGLRKSIDAVKSGALKNIGKSAVTEGVTEFAQESLESTATTVGTETGFDLARTVDQGIAGAVAGAGMGAGINAVSQASAVLREQGSPLAEVIDKQRANYNESVEGLMSVGLDTGEVLFSRRENEYQGDSLLGMHFSNTEGLRELDPSRFGEGMASSEMSRVQNGGVSDRVYFYGANEQNDPDKLFAQDVLPNTPARDKPEMGATGVGVYESNLDGMYNLKTDPLGLASSLSGNELEKAVLDEGFRGIYDPDALLKRGTAVVLDGQPVRVNELGRGEYGARQNRARSQNIQPSSPYVYAENIPSADKSEVGAFIVSLDEQAKNEFTDGAQEIFWDKYKGVDKIAESLGITQYKRRAGNGYYAGNVSPNNVLQFETLEDAAKYARAYKAITTQDAVPFSELAEVDPESGAFNGVIPEGLDLTYGVLFDLGSSPNSDAVKSFGKLFDQTVGKVGDSAGFTDEGNGRVQVMNFDNSAEFGQEVNNLYSLLLESKAGIEVRPIASVGSYNGGTENLDALISEFSTQQGQDNEQQSNTTTTQTTDRVLSEDQAGRDVQPNTGSGVNGQVLRSLQGEFNRFATNFAKERDTTGRFEGLSEEFTKGDKLFSTNSTKQEAPTQSLSVDDVNAYLADFIKEFGVNGGLDGLRFTVAGTQQEVFGDEATTDKYGIIEGAYLPNENTVAIVASSMRSKKDLKRVLRHEVIGHFGLNTFKPDVKKSFLDEIIKAKDSKGLKDVWSSISSDSVYGGQDTYTQAEEVFTRVMESEVSLPQKVWDAITSALRKLYRKTFGPDTVVSKSELRNEARLIAKGIREGGLRQGSQQAGYQAAFSKTEDRPADDIATPFMERVEGDFDALVSEYAQIPETEGGRVINTDDARELSEAYREDRSRAADVHAPASAFTKKLYAAKLAQPTPEGFDPTVFFMAGGAGAGKTTGREQLSLSTEPEMVYDTTLSKGEKDIRKIEQALDAGRDVRVMYVYREPVEAFRNGVVPRAVKRGRTVPIDAIAENHVGAYDTAVMLADKYADDPNVDIIFVDNSRGPNNAKVVSIDDLPTMAYTKQELKEALSNELESRKGEIPERIYSGLKYGQEKGQSEPQLSSTEQSSGGGVRESAEPSQQSIQTNAEAQGLSDRGTVQRGDGGVESDIDDALFSRRSESYADLTEEQKLERSKEKIGQKPPPPIESTKSKVQSWAQETVLNGSFWDQVKEGVFDQLRPIKQAEKAVGIDDVNKMGYTTARLATGVGDVMHGAMNFGVPEFTGENIVQRKEDTQGLFEHLSKLGDDLDAWLGWMAAKRAEKLNAEDRENNLTEGDIQRLKAAAKGKEKLFEEVRKGYMDHMNAGLDMAVHAGLLKKSSADKFKEDKYYIPFFRDRSDPDLEAGWESVADSIASGRIPMRRKGLTKQTSGIEKLTGSSMPTKPLLENIMSRYMTLVESSMKNIAAREVVENLTSTQTGLDNFIAPITQKEIGFLPESQRGHVVMVMQEGMKKHFHVKDPALFRAMTGLTTNRSTGRLMTIARKFKKLLTTGVTSSPDFMARNFIRDSVQAWMINKDFKEGKSMFTLGVDSMRGLKESWSRDENYRDMLFAGASFQGGYVHGADPEGASDMMRRNLRRMGYNKSEEDGYMSSLLKLDSAKDVIAQNWEKYREAGDRLENANRDATYRSARSAGKTKREAAFEAKDLMDYSMVGNYSGLLFLVDTIPFLNARIQGLYKLARAAKAEGGEAAVAKTLSKELAFKGAQLAALSAVLAMVNDDDERYQALADWDKDGNWHIFLGDQHFRVPKPFELGLVFGTMSERFTRAAFGTGTFKEFAESATTGAAGTLQLNPIPQIGVPFIEAFLTNKSFFTGAPIENMGDANRLPQDRFNTHTSTSMVALGQMLGMSPKKLEHMFTGYFGTMGGYVLSASDVLANTIVQNPTKPFDLRNMPVVKSFYQGSREARSTKYSTEFYDMLTDVNQVYGSYKARVDEGANAEELRDFLSADRVVSLRIRGYINKTQRQLSKIRSKMDMVNKSNMSSSKKADAIDELRKQKNQLTRNAVYMARQSGYD